MGRITINLDSLKSSRDWVRHKVNDGANIFRVLPPFGDPEVHNNYPYRKWSIVWLQDPKSGKRRPFATPMTDGEKCPVQEYNDALNVYIEERKDQLKTEGYSDNDIKAELEGLRSVQWNMRLQHFYAYNACDQAGSVGILELKSTAHKAMKKAMNQYIKDYGQDPTSLNFEEDDSGVWFNISKDGKGKETEYGVTCHQTRQKMNGQIVKIDDRTALPEHVVSNYESLAYNLNSIYQRKTYDELYSMLLFNLALIAQEVPEAVLPGYDISDVNVKAGTTILQETSEDEEETPVVKTTKKSAAKVTLNVDDEDEDETPVRKAPTATVKTTPVVAKPAKIAPLTKKAPVKTQAFDDDELSALTSEILGD